jgi:hypothetical protein
MEAVVGKLSMHGECSFAMFDYQRINFNVAGNYEHERGMLLLELQCRKLWWYGH